MRSLLPSAGSVDDASTSAQGSTSPSRGSGARRWIARAAVGVSALLLFARLAHIDWAPFMQDEPQFLLAAHQQLETGRWATHSLLVGNGGIRYGPTPLWFYGVVQAVLGSDAQRAIFVVALTVSLCELWLILALYRAFPRPSPWALACLLAFAAASPFELFWSRLAWDLFANFVPFAALALLCSPMLGPARATAFGVLMGLGFSAHPMMGPLVVIAFVALAASFVSRPRRAALVLGPAVVGFVLPNLPWFAYLIGQPRDNPVGHAGRAWSLDAWRWVATFRPHSSSGFSYFFDHDWSAFAVQHPWAASGALQAGSLFLASAISLLGLVLLVRTAHPGLRRIGAIGLACAIVYPLFYAKLRLGPHPHYQFPLSWLAVAGAAGLLCLEKRWLWPARGAVILLAASNLAFDAAWVSFVAERDGTRGIHYGTTIAEQQRFVDALCARQATDLAVVNRTAIFEYALRQHFEANPRCRPHTLKVCPPARCSAVPDDAHVVLLKYAGPQGGALRQPLPELSSGP